MRADKAPGRNPDHSWVEGVTLAGSDDRTARSWGEELFAPRPRFVVAAIRLRNGMGRILGLKPFGQHERSVVPHFDRRLGPFPVLAESDDRIEFGIADAHLTFRSELSVTAHSAGTRIEVTTRIWTHNALGRCYAAMLRLAHPVVMKIFLGHLEKSHSFSARH